MTQDAQRNLEYLQSSLERAGFSNLYHKAVEEGIREGASPIPLNFVDLKISEKEKMSFRPTIVEKADNPGFYIFTDFLAVKSVEGSPDVSIKVPHFKMSGLTVVQAQTVLNGGVVLHAEGEDANKVAKMFYTGIDSKKPVQDGEPTGLIRVQAKHYDLAKLLSRQRILGKDTERSLTFEKIQNGLKANVTLRVVENGFDSYPKATMRLALEEGKEPGKYDLVLQVDDPSGKSIQRYKQEAKEAKVIETGLTMRQEKKPEPLPGSTLQMAAGAQGGPTGGVRKRNS